MLARNSWSSLNFPRNESLCWVKYLGKRYARQFMTKNFEKTFPGFPMRPDSQHKSREKRFSVFQRPFCRFGKIAGFRFRAIPDVAIAEKCRHVTVVSRYSTPAFIKISATSSRYFEVKSIFDPAKFGKRRNALFLNFWLLCENQRSSPS